ncbi:DNA topoisomerase 3-beta-1 isoform X1 [Lampetra planeri]
MRTVLMVAEKPSLSQSIAKILSRGSMTSRKGFNGACSVHEYMGSFQGQSARFKMTSVCGHVMTLDFIGKYNNWDQVDPAELFSKAPTEKKEANPKLSMAKFLQIEGKGCDYVVLWLDCDREGENICFEVLDAIAPYPVKHGSEQVVFRAKFSAITDTDIHNAMNKLAEPNRFEALAVDARQEVDLRVGCAFTRFQTKYFQGKYGDLDASLVSFGPCQTPTLGFCVERHDRIQSFKPETYWVLQAKVSTVAGQALTLEWERGRMFDREVAQTFLAMVRGATVAKVLSVTQKEKAKQRPLALNTVEMLRIASSSLGMGPQHSMQVAERLYIQGYISYPRTETTSYPENFDLKDALRQQASSPFWGDLVRALLAQGLNKPRKGSDAGDHPPITPMRAATESELGGDAWRLYDYIVRHFIATVSEDCRYLLTTITLSLACETFHCVGKTLVSAGYTEVMPWQAIPLEESLPAVVAGDELPVDSVALLERQTGPPDYLTEAELITLMEKHGIGTDASIPVHINNVCQRNYVTVESGRRLKPTNLGIVLVHGYHKIDPELVLPTMRASVEKQLNLIAMGKADFQAVLQHALSIFQRKFHYFVDHIAGMDELMEVSFSPLAATGRPHSRCGKCRRFMKYIQAKPSRLHCSHCDDTYSLPHGGALKLYKELRCPLDEFELVLWTSGPRGKSYPLCPYCYSRPPFPDMKKGMGCNECTHPTCAHSLLALGVGQCVECEGGVLVFDPLSAPRWRMVCNRCSVLVHFFAGALRVKVVAASSSGTQARLDPPDVEDCARAAWACESCEAALVEVEYPAAPAGAGNNNNNQQQQQQPAAAATGAKVVRSPLPDGATRHVGCVFCDPVFEPLVQLKHARAQRARRGGGRGGPAGAGPVGGRGGRGGGGGGFRGGRKPRDKMAALDAYFV